MVRIVRTCSFLLAFAATLFSLLHANVARAHSQHPAYPQHIECSTTVEHDSVYTSGVQHNFFSQHADGYGYLDVLRDSVNNVPCDIRATERVFPYDNCGAGGTTGACTWTLGGNVEVCYSDSVSCVNGSGVIAGSQGKNSATSTYPGHYVIHGPWVGFDYCSGSNGYWVFFGEYYSSSFAKSGYYCP